MYDKRFYRDWVDTGLVNFNVTVGQSDILFSADKDLRIQAEKAIIKYRSQIEKYININPEFLTSLEPISVNPHEFEAMPEIIKRMVRSSARVNVGPMASIAGAIADFVGRELMEFTEDILVENGGDIFLKSSNDRIIGIFAGESPLSGRLSFRVKSEDTPIGISTSSGTVGHSLSFGKADAVLIISKDTILSDAAATAVCNMVKSESAVEKALNYAKSIEGVKASVIIYGNKVGSIGDIEIA